MKTVPDALRKTHIHHIHVTSEFHTEYFGGDGGVCVFGGGEGRRVWERSLWGTAIVSCMSLQHKNYTIFQVFWKIEAGGWGVGGQFQPPPPSV